MVHPQLLEERRPRTSGLASPSAEVEVLVRNLRFASVVCGPMPLLKVLAAALLASLALGGCETVGPQFSASQAPLVVIDAHGGHCVEGECKVVTTIRRDSRLIIEGAGVGTVEKVIDPSLYSAFAAAVDATDYAAITAVRFTGECPTAFDGQELTYTFNPTGRAPVTFSSCEVAIPPNHPLFQALDAVILQSAP